MKEIFLTPILTGLILLVCLYFVWKGRVDWATGTYLSLASWAGVIRFGSVNHIWVFSITMVGAAGVYWLKHPGLSIIPRRDAWIVLWLMVWWGWMLFLLSLSDISPTEKNYVLVPFLFYNTAPIPIFLLFAADLLRLKGFALAYLFTSIVGGGVAFSQLFKLGVSLADLYRDPFLSNYESGTAFWFANATGGMNYLAFAYAFGISLVLILALVFLYRRSFSFAMLIMGAAYCTYFLLMSTSKQIMLSTAIVGLLFALWAIRRRIFRMRIILLTGVVAAIFLSVLFFRPEWILRSTVSLSEAFNIVKDRGPSWAEGWDAFVRSPLIGVGFSQGTSLGHNIFLNTLGNQGLVGMVFFIGFLVFLGKQVRGIWAGKGTREQAIWRMAFLCLALLFLFAGQASGSPESAWPLFWSAVILWRLKEAVEKSEASLLKVVSVGQPPN
jgi:O-antigen ligase